METNFQRYSIDKYLKRYSKAIQHLSVCGKLKALRYVEKEWWKMRKYNWNKDVIIVLVTVIWAIASYARKH